MKTRFRLSLSGASGSKATVKKPNRPNGGDPPAGEVVAQGVPLPKLIKRRLEPRPELVMISQPRSIYAERFRRLKTTLVSLGGEDLRVLIVTSGVPNEGKSTVSTNLALAFGSEADERAILVDADMRRPSIGGMLQPTPKLGLTEVLQKKTTLEHAVLELDDIALDILPGGSPVDDPLRLITSKQAGQLLEELRGRYRWVILDTPPIIPFTDADALGALSDGILLVVRSGVTPVSVYKQALSSVTTTRVVGTVFNDASSSPVDGGGYYSKYYHAYYNEERR